jgi:hypothetical protein
VVVPDERFRSFPHQEQDPAMIQDFNVLDTSFSFFVAVNWVYAIFGTWWLANLFATRRYLFIKPSIIILTYTNIFFQWPLAVFAGYYEKWLPNPYTIVILVHGFVVIGLSVSTLYLEKDAFQVWNAIRIDHRQDQSGFYTKSILLLTAIVVTVTVVYLSYVPITSTGIYSIFFNPAHSAIAREESLKLLEYGGLKYAYSIMSSSVVPLLLALIVMSFLSGGKKINKIWGIGIFLIVCLSAISVSLTGARIGLLNMVLIVALVFLWNTGLSVHPAVIGIVVLLALSPPIILSVLREGKSLEDLKNLYFMYLGYVSHRAFITPLDVGSWYIHYAQTNGAMGIGAFPKLAGLAGVDPVDGPNLIGLAYASQNYGEQVLKSVSATSGYLFSSYGYLGIVAFPLALLGLWLTDIAVMIFRRLNKFILIPCMASISLASLMFIQSDYTVVWLTHGFGVILLFSLALTKFIES